MIKENENSCHCGSNINNDKDKKEKYNYIYRIQLGVFRTYNHAIYYQIQVINDGYAADIEKQGELFTVNTGDFDELEQAVLMERYLKYRGYNTVLIAI